jgi:acetyl-CoA carboxylase biotin carboxyl carrier protein
MSDFGKLKEFINIAKSEGVTELSYEGKDQKFGSQQVVATPSPVGAANPLPTTPTKALDTTTNSDCHEITSPFVGTFYGAPAPGKPNFVKVGDKVSKGQTLCILEAMKIMNEIESDVDGEIVEICASNESLVEFGQTLFKVR